MRHYILINFYLFFLQKCNFDHSELPKNSVLERIWNMQRLSYVNTNYIYNVYSNFTSLLNDDMIYSDLIKLNKTRIVFHASLGNPMVGIFSYTNIQKKEFLLNNTWMLIFFYSECNPENRNHKGNRLSNVS